MTCSLDTEIIISLMRESILPQELDQNTLNNFQQGDRLKDCSVLLSKGKAVSVHEK